MLLALLALMGCRQGMFDQGRTKPLRESGLFPDHNSSRPLPAGTVAQSEGELPAELARSRVNGQLVATLPLKVTRELLGRGQERFNIYCSPCHDRLGHGTGMIVRRGFRTPPSYHIERLVNAPDGYFFEVITQGYGTMYSYADRVAPRDRWAITAYIRALQVSQHAGRQDVPPAEWEKLEKQKP